MTAARATPGATCLSNSSHFPIIEGAKLVKPVVLPPGRAMLATKWLPTGSDTPMNTIGIVYVACSRAAVAGVELPTSTSGFKATSSFSENLRLIRACRCKAIIDKHAAAFLPAVALKCLPECREPGLYLRVYLGVADKHSDPTGRLFARIASGHVAAVPPTSVMKPRQFILVPRPYPLVLEVERSNSNREIGRAR